MEHDIRAIKINGEHIDIYGTNGAYAGRRRSDKEWIDISAPDLRRAYPELIKVDLYRVGFHFTDSEHTNRGKWTTDKSKDIDDPFHPRNEKRTSVDKYPIEHDNPDEELLNGDYSEPSSNVTIGKVRNLISGNVGKITDSNVMSSYRRSWDDVQVKLKEEFDKISDKRGGVTVREFILAETDNMEPNIRYSPFKLEKLLSGVQDHYEAMTMLSIVITDFLNKGFSMDDLLKVSFDHLENIKSRDYFFNNSGLLCHKGDK